MKLAAFLSYQKITQQGILIIFISLFCMRAFAQSPTLSEKKFSPILNLADKQQIRSRIIYLSDDKLLGRAPGTPGYQMAVDFVINELKGMGIKPKGTNGYLQEVRLRKGAIDSTQSYLTLGDQRLRYGKDFTMTPDLSRSTSQASGNVVFAGYGITAPHLQHDDYKNLDVKGKIVVIRDGVPENFPTSERAHFNLAVTKCEAANRQGAVGVIILLGGNETLRLGAQSRASLDGTNGYIDSKGKGFSSRTNVYDGVQFLAYARASLFADMMKDDALPTNLKIEGKATTILTDIKSENVIGVIEGTDKKLKNEYVVHTAHLDHLGVSTPVKGDSIYNGAHDNASGVACLLEIAKLYSQVPSKRSVLIVFVTSEEKGLLGSGFFAANPTVPKENIVADINTDMPTLIAPLLSIVPLGAVHSSLMNPVKEAARLLSLDVMEDHIPEQVRFVRSDQYSFIRQGIPALHIKYGLKTNDPSLDLRKKIDEWTAAHYHKPSDEFSDAAFDFDAGVVYVKLNFLIGWQVANEVKRPTWNKGDFFGETFGGK